MKNITARSLGIAIVAVTGLLVAYVGISRALRPQEPHVELDRGRYPVCGLDLSSHNGIVDFDSVSGAGIDFVYLKASEGASFRDLSFATNYAGARRTGIKAGAYHFFRFDRDGRSQADNLLEAVAGCKLDLPLAIDVEESWNPAGPSTEIIVERLRTMVAHLRSAGHNVVIYTNKTGEARFLRNNFDNAAKGDPELWICSFTDPPLSRRQWALWQHSHRGKVPGVQGVVDLNTFNGDRSKWDAWLEGHVMPQ